MEQTYYDCANSNIVNVLNLQTSKNGSYTETQNICLSISQGFTCSLSTVFCSKQQSYHVYGLIKLN